jgi:ubiquitin carboxyl-terminal hydrolase 7
MFAPRLTHTQRLFYHLQTESDAVPTKELTKSFGWTGAEAFMQVRCGSPTIHFTPHTSRPQHDVQEFLRVLMDNIEEKMKETPVAGFVPNLFAGTTQSYIRCTEVAFEVRSQSFCSLAFVSPLVASAAVVGVIVFLVHSHL